MAKKRIKVPPGYRLIFRPFITVGGRRIYAYQRGLRAFPLLVPVDE